MGKSMVSNSDANGFLFINTTPMEKLGKNQQRQVRSHVSRGRPRSRRHGNTSLPVAGNDEGGVSALRLASQKLPFPRPVGTTLSWTRLPEPIKPRAVHDGIRFMHIVNSNFYPLEICLPLSTSMTSTWIDSLVTDPTYVHAVTFATETYGNTQLGKGQDALTQFHLLKTLRSLQERVSNPGDPLAICDQTIMTVVVLALTSIVLGDETTLMNHLGGLVRMVNLRGGFETIGVETDQLATKICIIDLAVALRRDQQPSFFRSGLSWARCLDDGTLTDKRRAHTDADRNEADAFVESLDPRLFGIWQDLKQFSYLSNLAYRSGHRLHHAFYGETMVLILYRLLHLTQENCAAGNAARLGLITFASSMLFRWEGSWQDHTRLMTRFGDALQKLRKSSPTVTIPQPMIFWMLLMWHQMWFPGERQHDSDWLSDVINNLQISSWDEARTMVKAVIWIDFLHDRKGEAVFLDAFTKMSPPDSQDRS